MTDTEQLVRFAEEFQREVSDRLSQDAQEEGPAYSEAAFVEYTIELLSEIGALDGGEECYTETTGARNAIIKLNGYAINVDEGRLDLITAIFNPEPLVALSRDEADRALTRARRVAPFAFSGAFNRMEPASPSFAMMKQISDLRSKLRDIRIILITNGVFTSSEPSLDAVEDLPVGAEIWDIERFFRSQLATLPREEIEIDFVERFGQSLPCLPDRKRAGYTAYLALVPGNVLADLYHEFGPRLLELNVRSFLSASGKINKGIRKTLANAPDAFLAYNNGIVITADWLEVDHLDQGGYGLRCIRGIQIVNGGQTTASVHRARYVDRMSLDDVTVPVKIIVVPQERLEEMVRTVSLYANSQNVIQIADFSANDPFHVDVERLSTQVWCPDGRGRWFYERARGQYQVAKSRAARTARGARKFEEQTPAHRRFTKTELAKYIWAWDPRPHSVSLGAQKAFELFMQEHRARRQPEWHPDEVYFKQLVAKAILFRAVLKLTKQAHFPASTPNIAVYTVSCLSWATGGNLDFDRIWQTQAISAELAGLLGEMIQIVDQALRAEARGRMVSESAKKEQCWNVIRETPFTLPDPLPPELLVRATQTAAGSAVHAQQAVDPGDLQNIEACRRLGGEEWLRIHAWGTRTGQLTYWQCGIAQTLAGYAATSWQRNPSPKQARQGVIILEKARDLSEVHAEPE